MDVLLNNLALFIPIIVLQILLSVIALVHILRHDTYKVGSRVVWIIVVLCVQTIGPILYFVIGRSEE